jgi:hypothetical protein
LAKRAEVTEDINGGGDARVIGLLDGDFQGLLALVDEVDDDRLEVIGSIGAELLGAEEDRKPRPIAKPDHLTSTILYQRWGNFIHYFSILIIRKLYEKRITRA